MGWLSDTLFQFSNALAGLNIEDFFKEDDEDGPVSLQVGKKTFQNVPRAMRTELWLSQLHRSGGMGDKASLQYKNLLHIPLEETVRLEIDKDLHRTFPAYRRVSSPEGQEAMRGVLHAYAAFDPEIGYTQGLNFIAALLLTYISNPAKAFGALVVLMKARGLRELYLPDMSLLQIRLWQLGRLMPPSLANHMESQAALPVLFAPSWLMGCFASDFPLHFSSRVMDLVITDSRGQTAPLIRVSLALLEAAAPQLMQLHDLEDLLRYLKHDVPRWSREQLQELISNALEKPWSKRQMKILENMNGAESVADAVRRVDAALVGQHTTTSNADEDSSKAHHHNQQQQEQGPELTAPVPTSGPLCSKAAILDSINSFQGLLVSRNHTHKDEEEKKGGGKTDDDGALQSESQATAPTTTNTNFTNTLPVSRAMLMECLPSPTTLETLPREWAFIDPLKRSVEVEIDPGLSSRLSLFSAQRGGGGGGADGGGVGVHELKEEGSIEPGMVADAETNNSSDTGMHSELKKDSGSPSSSSGELRSSPFYSTSFRLSSSNGEADRSNHSSHHKLNLSMISQEFGSFKTAQPSPSIDKKEREEVVHAAEELSSEVKASRLVETSLSQLRSSLPLLKHDDSSK
jgi:hypothetical protein